MYCFDLVVIVKEKKIENDFTTVVSQSTLRPRVSFDVLGQRLGIKPSFTTHVAPFEGGGEGRPSTRQMQTRNTRQRPQKNTEEKTVYDSLFSVVSKIFLPTYTPTFRTRAQRVNKRLSKARYIHTPGGGGGYMAGGYSATAKTKAVSQKTAREKRKPTSRLKNLSSVLNRTYAYLLHTLRTQLEKKQPRMDTKTTCTCRAFIPKEPGSGGKLQPTHCVRKWG